MALDKALTLSDLTKLFDYYCAPITNSEKYSSWSLQIQTAHFFLIIITFILTVCTILASVQKAVRSHHTFKKKVS